MHTQNSAIYPMALGDAHDIALRLDLPGVTIIEPSRFTAFLCTGPNDALHFFIRFPEAERWHTHDPELLLFLVATRPSDEVRSWSEQNPSAGLLLELVAIAFESATDQHRFEAAL
jgi:hypothetical protein